VRASRSTSPIAVTGTSDERGKQGEPARGSSRESAARSGRFSRLWPGRRIVTGRAGSALAVLLAWAATAAPFGLRVAAGGLLVAAGFLLCGESARRLGVRDHAGIVLDEIAAMYLVLLVVPPTPTAWALAFGLFRLFDIWKPWPIRDLDHRLSGSPGIMLDDLAAALYAASLLRFGGWLMT
jgi:phosphatidylglycerophosphatase A